jgi:hypothetical protein
VEWGVEGCGFDDGGVGLIGREGGQGLQEAIAVGADRGGDDGRCEECQLQERVG